jgi:putative redox protein
MNMEISFPGGLRVDAQLGGLTIPTDQPVMAGGGGSAPSPFLLFLGSIGTCAGIYVLQFCRQRGIPTDDIKIIQHHENRPGTNMIGRVTLEIQVPPSFPERYRTTLQKVAAQCAVKKHLELPPELITTTTVVGEEGARAAV